MADRIPTNAEMARKIIADGIERRKTDTPAGKAVQKAWAEMDVVQCGWCQSGQMLAAAALLTATPKPTEQQITDGMTSNICRCATYHRIRGAVARASEIMG